MVKKFFAIAILAFTCVNWAGSAQADQIFKITQVNWNPTIKGTITDTHGTTNVNITGGGVFGATLDGIPLAATYCLDIRNDIYGWTNYTSIVNQTGYVYGYPETNAGAVAWLVNNIGLQYVPGAADANATAGLQALIWELVSPNTHSPQGVQTFHFVAASNSAAVVAGYNYALNALNTAANFSVNHNYASLDAWKTAALWITPHPGTNSSTYSQAQVSAIPGAHPNVTVPEPSSIALLGLGGIGSAVGAIRRRRQQKA